MPVQNINLRDHISLERLFDFCAERRHASPQYQRVDNAAVYDAYTTARRHNLRFNRKTNVLRDDRLGVLARPSNPSEWPEADLDEAREQIMREVWCSAVGAFNRANM